MSPCPGHFFAGYEILRPLARGGMTELFLALNERRERIVLRLLRQECAHDRRLREAFLHSAEILVNLDHPNVITLLEAGTCDDRAYMILEFIEGLSLRQRILDRSPLLAQNALTLLRQMAAALSYIHLSGFWHLDFKPENLMIRDDGLVVLIDFDLAAARRAKPVKVNPLPGTFAYLPPETLLTHVIQDETDIYAFGVTAYELLAGFRPFEGSSVEESKRLQLKPRHMPPSLRKGGLSVHPAIEHIVFKCLAYDVAARYLSMSVVLRDLEAIV